MTVTQPTCAARLTLLSEWCEIQGIDDGDVVSLAVDKWSITAHLHAAALVRLVPESPITLRTVNANLHVMFWIGMVQACAVFNPAEQEQFAEWLKR